MASCGKSSVANVNGTDDMALVAWIGTSLAEKFSAALQESLPASWLAILEVGIEVNYSSTRTRDQF